MHSSLKLFVIKIIFFSIVLAYFAIDLLWWHGPISDYIVSKRDGPAAADVTARIYDRNITYLDLHNAHRQRAFLAGMSAEAKPKSSRDLLGIIRAEILKKRVIYNDSSIPKFEEEAELQMNRLASRFASEEEFAAQLALIGEDRVSFTEKTHALLREHAMMLAAVKDLYQVSDAAVMRHYELLKDDLRIPASRRVSHIFFPTVNKDAKKIKQKAERLFQKLKASSRLSQDFAQLARRHSEDSATASSGGDLGIIHDDLRVTLPEFSLFGDAALLANQVQLRPSKWGWHIILAGPIHAARIPSFKESQSSIRTGLESAQRSVAVNAYLDMSIKILFQSEKVKLYDK